MFIQILIENDPITAIVVIISKSITNVYLIAKIKT